MAHLMWTQATGDQSGNAPAGHGWLLHVDTHPLCDWISSIGFPDARARHA